MSAKSSVLYAAAKEIGAHCASENDAFLRCKANDENPEVCLAEGERVQTCALGVLKSAMETCGDAFQQYADCLDKQISQEYMFERCRKTEAAFVECRSLTAQSSYDAPAAEGAEKKVVAAAVKEVKGTREGTREE